MLQILRYATKYPSICLVLHNIHLNCMGWRHSLSSKTIVHDDGVSLYLDYSPTFEHIDGNGIPVHLFLAVRHHQLKHVHAFLEVVNRQHGSSLITQAHTAVSGHQLPVVRDDADVVSAAGSVQGHGVGRKLNGLVLACIRNWRRVRSCVM